MFTVEDRERVRRRLLDLAAADPGIVGAALVGSYAADGGDRWSDIDLAIAVEDRDASLQRWTDLMHREFAAVHHWDLPAGPIIYRVFLLPDWLEIDIGFTPASEFGPRGPHWQTIFGETVPVPGLAAPRPGDLAGLAWHHALHALVCIERERFWQAQYWIAAVRDQVMAMACLRLGYPTSYAKGAHLLPPELTTALEGTLVRSLDAVELRRAFEVAVGVLADELRLTDAELAARMAPMLEALVAKPSR